jgi:hypothetical protein
LREFAAGEEMRLRIPRPFFISWRPKRWPPDVAFRAFSSEVDAGSREENASKQESRASVLIQSEPKL